MKTVAIIAFAIIYTLSPIDVLPDVIPVLGWLDDAGVISWAVAALKNSNGRVT